MNSSVKTYEFPDGEIQRVQVARPGRWEDLEFFRPAPSEDALACFARIYRKFLVPACPWLFGQMVLFRLPEDCTLALPTDTAYGHVNDRLIAAAALLRKDLRLVGGTPRFRTERAQALWTELKQKNCLQIVCGKLPFTTVIPVAEAAGYLSASDTAMAVNASFFIMDRFDCATVYDRVGMPFGLLVKDGIVEQPPLYRREALMVYRDGTTAIETPDVRDLALCIGGQRFRHGESCTIYTRPERSHTPMGRGLRIVVSGNRVAAVCRGGRVPIPASGFVIVPRERCTVQPGEAVAFAGMEDVSFGIQVGGSAVRSGIPTDRFLSRFYNIRKLERVPFPPSLYPMHFDRDRAARIALGADADGSPVLLWAEGAAKAGHKPGQDSRGATLSDMARYCIDAGMVNAVNLDGGGSAQLLLNGRRALKISDRRDDGTESERPVPLALIVK